MLMNRAFFPSGLISYVNIQRQFFDSFVGQTFKVANHCHMLPQFAFHNFVQKSILLQILLRILLRIILRSYEGSYYKFYQGFYYGSYYGSYGLLLAGCGQAGPWLHAGLRLRERDAQQDELCRAADRAFHCWNIEVFFLMIFIVGILMISIVGILMISIVGILRWFMFDDDDQSYRNVVRSVYYHPKQGRAFTRYLYWTIKLFGTYLLPWCTHSPIFIGSSCSFAPMLGCKVT